MDKGFLYALIFGGSGGGGGGGTTNYNALSNKPKINGVTLTGDLSGDDLRLGGGSLGREIRVSNAIGNCKAGDVFPVGTSFDDIFQLMLSKTVYPTFVDPSCSIGYSGDVLLAVGDSLSNVPINVLFNAGAINLGGSKQADRAGAATEYRLVVSGGASAFDQTNTSGAFTVPSITRTSKGNITLTGRTSYAKGAQPKDSDGNDYGSPLQAGSVSGTKTIEFILPFLWGASASATPDLSALTKDLAKKSAREYRYTTNNERVTFAYDSSYGRLTSILDQNGFETISGYNILTIGDYTAYVAELPSTDTNAKNTFIFNQKGDLLWQSK